MDRNRVVVMALLAVLVLAGVVAWFLLDRPVSPAAVLDPAGQEQGNDSVRLSSREQQVNKGAAKIQDKGEKDAAVTALKPANTAAPVPLDASKTKPSQPDESSTTSPRRSSFDEEPEDDMDEDDADSAPDVQSPDAEPGEIHGLVLSDATEGVPMLGVTVSLKRGTYFGADTIARTVTAQDGTFRFTGVKPNKYMVTAAFPTQGKGDGDSYSRNKFPKHYKDMARVDVVSGQTHGPISLRVAHPGNIVSFRLVDPANGQVEASLRGQGGFELSTNALKVNLVLAGTDGVYRLGGLNTNQTELRLKATGYAETVFPIAPVAGQDLDLGLLTLSRGMTVAGVVTNSGGLPLEGVTLTLRKKDSALSIFEAMGDDNDDFASTLGAPKPVVLKTDANGKFAFENLGAASYRLELVLAGYATTQVSLNVKNDEDQPDLRLTLASGATMSGKVSYPGGLPKPYRNFRKPGAGFNNSASNDQNLVALIDPNNPPVLNVHKGDPVICQAENAPLRVEILKDGTYRFDFVPPGTYRAVAVLGSQRRIKDNVVLQDGNALTLDFDFAGTASVYGRVIGADGRPAAKVTMQLHQPASAKPASSEPQTTTTDDFGNYRFKAVAPGIWYVGVEGEPESERYMPDRAAITGDDNDVEVSIDLSKKRGVTLRIKALVGGQAIFKKALITEAGTRSHYTREALLDGDGQGQAFNLSQGTYYIWLTGSMDLVARDGACVRETITVSGTEGTQDFIRDWKPANVRGTVQAPEGFDRKRVMVYAAPVLDDSAGRDGWLQSMLVGTACNDNGEFRFVTLAAATYRFMAIGEGFATEQETLAASGEVSLSFALAAPASTLAVKIASISGDKSAGPAPGYPYGQFLLFHADGTPVPLARDQVAMHNTNAGTIRRVSSLAPGAYRLEILSASIERYTATLEIGAGQSLHHDANLHRGASINLVLTNPGINDILLQSANIEVLDKQGHVAGAGEWTGTIYRSSTIAKPRTLTIAPLVAGQYTIKVRLPGYQPFETQVEVGRSSVVEKTMTLVKQ